MASASFQNATHKALNLLSPVLLFHLWLWSRFSWPPLPRSSLSGGRTHKDFRQDWGQPIHSADSLCGKLQLTPHSEQITNTLIMMTYFTIMHVCACVFCVCMCVHANGCKCVFRVRYNDRKILESNGQHNKQHKLIRVSTTERKIQQQEALLISQFVTARSVS